MLFLKFFWTSLLLQWQWAVIICWTQCIPLSLRAEKPPKQEELKRELHVSWRLETKIHVSNILPPWTIWLGQSSGIFICLRIKVIYCWSIMFVLFDRLYWHNFRKWQISSFFVRFYWVLCSLLWILSVHYYGAWIIRRNIWQTCSGSGSGKCFIFSRNL